jgi:hypothetical protein
VPRFAVIRRGRFIAYTTPTDARKTIDGTTFHGHTRSVAFLVFKPLADTVNGVAVSLSGNLVAAAFANQRAELRAADSGAILATLPTTNVELQAVHSARTSPRWPWQAWRPRLTGTK